MLHKIACIHQRVNFNVIVSYQQQTFITADQSAFQRAGTTGQYTITGQHSPLTSVGGQAVVATSQRQLNGQFVDPSATTNQPVAYERQDYVNGYQQQVSISVYLFISTRVVRKVLGLTKKTRVINSKNFLNFLM